MIIKIDWLSFTVPVQYPANLRPHLTWEYAAGQVDTATDGVMAVVLDGIDFELSGGRAPFKQSLKCAEHGIFIWFDQQQPFVLVEFSGIGCDMLRGASLMDTLLEKVQPRITRLDVAADMLCDVEPRDFANERSNKRFKSGAEMFSDKGKTVYVGSEKSARFARVYRYNPPHPRHKFLRCEMVVRDENAKDTARAILEFGLDATTVELGKAFGWSHEQWQVTAPNRAELTAFTPERHGGKTVYWLHAQVLPALEKMIREGKRDQVEEFRNQVVALLKD